MGEALPLTGERTVPGVARENYWFRRHEVVYEWLTRYMERRSADSGQPSKIVDAGCGEGYGAQLLAGRGALCVAIDLDVMTINHVASRSRGYAGGVRPVAANLDSLPLRTASVDLVVSLQVIEHLWDLPGFMAECRRVLRPGGELILSTPNRITFSPGLGRGERPTNPFHVEEFDAEQMGNLLTAAGMARPRLHGVWHGQRIAEWERQHGPLVAAQVAAIQATHWPPALDAFVSTVTTADFRIAPLAAAVDEATALDLVAVAANPDGDRP